MRICKIGQYQVSGFQSPFGTMGATKGYYDDGRTNTAYDLNDSRFDRKYEFDFAARLKEAYFVNPSAGINKKADKCIGSSLIFSLRLESDQILNMLFSKNLDHGFRLTKLPEP
jgi:hypothetical protein